MRTLAELDGTKWTGAAELWLDPLGNQAVRSDCTMTIDGNVIAPWGEEARAVRMTCAR